MSCTRWLIVPAVVSLALFAGAAAGATSTWIAIDELDPFWSTPGNWDPGAPAGTDTAVFDDTGTVTMVDLQTTVLINQVQFAGSRDYTLFGGKLIMGSLPADPRIFQNSSSTNTISAGIQTIPGADLQIDVAGGKLVIASDNGGAGGIGSGTASVTNGATLTVVHPDSLGAADIHLDGGRLELFSEGIVGASTDGIQTYWSFNDGTGTDGSINGNDGVVTNATPVGGRPGQGQALQFTGNGSVYDDDGELYINGQNELTVAMWIKSVGVFVDRGIWEAVDSGSADAWGARYDSESGSDPNVIKLGITTTESGDNNNRNEDQLVSSINVQTTDWQHVTFTWENGVGGKLFIDGVENALLNSIDSPTGTTALADRFTVGDGSKNPWQGLIDEVYVYNRAMDATEITALMDAPGVSTIVSVGSINQAVTVSGSSAIDSGADASLPFVTLNSGAALATPGAGELTVGLTYLMGSAAIDNAARLDPGAMANLSGGAIELDKSGAGELALTVGSAGGLADTTIVLNEGTVSAIPDGATTTLDEAAVRMTGGRLKLEGSGRGGWNGAPTAGLLGYWSFDNVAGSTVVNAGSLAAAADGTLIDNAAIDGSGKYGNAVTLDGTGDCVNVGNDAGLNFTTGNWSIAAWVQNDNQGTGDDNKGTIFGNGGDQTGGIRYAAIVTEQNDGNVTLLVDDNASSPGSSYNKQQFNAGPAVNDNTWHHVVGMRDGGTLRLFIDGTQVGTLGINAAYDLTGIDQHNAYIGAITDNRDASLYKFFIGKIDEVFVYDRALDATEVGEVMIADGGITPGVFSSTDYGTDIEVLDDATIEIIKNVDIGDLTIDGLTKLTIEGLGRLRADSLTIDPNGGSSFPAIETGGILYAGKYDDQGTPAVFTKQGGGDLVFDNLTDTPTDTGTVMYIQGGSVVVVADAANNPLPATFYQLEGGSLVFSSADGSDLSVANLVGVSLGASGALEARQAAGGAAGPVTVSLSAMMAVGAGSTLTLATDDDYTIRLDGTTTGDGDINVAGRVDANGNIAMGGGLRVEATGGLHGLADVAAGLVAVDVGGQMEVDGALAAGSAELAGTVDVHGTAAATVEVTVNDGVTTLDQTLTSPKVTVNGGVLNVAGLTTADDVEVGGGQFNADGGLVAPDSILVTGAQDAAALRITGSLETASVTLNGGTTTVTGDLDANGLWITGGVLIAGGALTVDHVDQNDQSHFSLSNGGKLITSGANALSGLPNFTVADQGTLTLGLAQSFLPVITVQSGSLLDGNMVGAVFRGISEYDPQDPCDAGVNVVFQDDAVFGAIAGTGQPTLEELGTDRLVGAIRGGAQTFDVDKDGNIGIYKGVAYGPWTASIFTGSITEAVAGQGLEVQLNQQDVVLDTVDANFATFNTTNTDTGVDFTGRGTLSILDSLSSGLGSASTFTRTGLPLDDPNTTVNTEILRLEGSGTVGNFQTFKLFHGRMSIHASDAIDDDSNMIIGDGATLMLDDGADARRPSAGTYTVKEGGMVWVNGSNRLDGVGGNLASFNWEPNSLLAYRADGFDPAAHHWPTNAHFVSDNDGTDTFTGAGLVVSDGAYLVGRNNGNSRIDDNGTGVRALQTADPGHKVGVAAPTGRIYRLEDVFDLTVDPNGIPGDGDEFVLDLVLGNDQPMTTVQGNNNRDRVVVNMTGDVRVRDDLFVGRIDVKSGSLRFQGENDDSATQLWRTGDIYVHDFDDASDLRFDNKESGSFGPGPNESRIEGTIYHRGEEFWIDSDGVFTNALTNPDPNYWIADEFVIGGRSRLQIEMQGGTTPKPWDPAGQCRIIYQALRFEADDPNWRRDESIELDDDSGPATATHRYLPNITLEEGAVFRVNETNTVVFVDLTLEGNARTSERDSRGGNSEDFELVNVTSLGDYTLTIGEAGEENIHHSLLGLANGADGNTLTIALDPANGRLSVQQSATLGPDLVIDHTGLPEDDRLNIYKGQTGEKWGDSNAVIQLHDDRALRIFVDDHPTPGLMRVNELDVSVKVMADSTARLRLAEGLDSNSAGRVTLNRLLLDSNSMLHCAEDSGQDYLLNGEVVGTRGAISNVDGGGNGLVGDWTGTHLVLTGGRLSTETGSTWWDVIGDANVATLTTETGVDGNGTPRHSFSVNFLGTSKLTADEAFLNAPTVFDAAATVTLTDAHVGGQVTLNAPIAGNPNWELNPGGELVANGLATLVGSTFDFNGGQLTLKEDGDTIVGFPPTVTAASRLGIDRLTPAGGTDATFTFGQLSLAASGAKLTLVSGNGYDYQFAGTSVDADGTTVEIESGNTDANVGPVTFTTSGSLSLDAAEGSTITLGPLDDGGFTGGAAQVWFGGGQTQGGNLKLSNSTNWDAGNPVVVLSGWLIVDGPLTGIDFVDASQGGIDVRADGLDLTNKVSRNLKLSAPMVGATAPTAAIAGELVVAAPVDGGFKRFDGSAIRLDAGGAVRGGLAGADMQAPIDILGDVTIGDAQGRGTDFVIGGAINGPGGIEKVGAERATLAGVNGYDGNTLVSAGTLEMAGPDAFGTGDTTVAIGTTLELAADVNYGGAVHSLGTVRATSGDTDLGSTVITGAAPTTVTPTAGMLGYWSFDNVSGSTVVNEGSLGASANGALADNAAVVAGGKYGAAVTLDGTGDHVDLGNPTGLDFGPGDFTLSAWIKTPVSSPGNPPSIVSKGANWDDGARPGIRWYFNIGESGAEPVAISLDDDAAKVNTNGTTQVNDDEWHHAVAMRVGRTVRIYVDGALEADAVDTLPAGYTLDTSAYKAYIGAIADARDPGLVPARFFDGLIDEVRIYDHGLEGAELDLLLFSGSTIQVDAGASMALGGFTNAGRVLVDGTLTMDDTDSDTILLDVGAAGLLDLNDSTLTVREGSIAEIAADLAAGYNGGGWDGAVGIIDSTLQGGAHPNRGVGVATVGVELVVEVALLADTDLSGTVDYNDYVMMRDAFGGPGGWPLGDTNYDGILNHLDYLNLKRNYGTSLTGMAAPLPEPATMGLLAFGAAGLLLRRRRSRPVAGR